MKKIIYSLFLSLIVAFFAGEASALRYEYSVTGRIGEGPFTPSTWYDIKGTFVLSDQLTPGSFGDYYAMNDMHLFSDIMDFSGSARFYHPIDPMWVPFISMQLTEDISDGGFYWSYVDGTQVFIDPPDYSIRPSLFDRPEIFGTPFHILECESEFCGGSVNFSSHYYRIENFVATRSHSVPEPSTLIILGSGLFGLYAVRKKIKKN